MMANELEETFAGRLVKVDPAALKDPQARARLVGLGLKLAIQGIIRANLGLELAAACAKGAAAEPRLAREGRKLRERCLSLREGIEKLLLSLEVPKGEGT